MNAINNEVNNFSDRVANKPANASIESLKLAVSQMDDRNFVFTNKLN